MNRPQPEVTVSVDPKTDYAFLVRALGGQLLDLGHSGLPLIPFHPGGHELVADDPTSAGDSR